MRKIVVGFAVTAVVFALITPSLADRIGVLLAATAAVGLMGEVVLRLTRELDYPPARALVSGEPRALPYELAALSDEVEISARAGVLSARLQATIEQLATARLRSRHDFDAANRDQAAAVRTLVSPSMWAIVAPRPRLDSPPRRVPATDLDQLLAELEEL